MASAAKAGHFTGTLIGTPKGVPFRGFHTDSPGRGLELKIPTFSLGERT
jgi:hypothetical protein